MTKQELQDMARCWANRTPGFLPEPGEDLTQWGEGVLDGVKALDPTAAKIMEEMDESWKKHIQDCERLIAHFQTKMKDQPEAEECKLCSSPGANEFTWTDHAEGRHA